MRLWIERSFSYGQNIRYVGQPRMRLWIERWILSVMQLFLLRSASYEAVNWKTIRERYGACYCRSASYEAVNWKKEGLWCLLLCLRVSLVWGCELKERICSWSLNVSWSASYEAVNWKILGLRLVRIRIGQPRMRLWIERFSSVCGSVRVYGQPRMRLWIERCILRYTSFFFFWSASYEAVNWKHELQKPVRNFYRSASYEAVNWKLYAYTGKWLYAGSASYEAVNWKNLDGVQQVALYNGQPRMRLWIERT